jgi:hypothetical protein
MSAWYPPPVAGASGQLTARLEQCCPYSTKRDLEMKVESRRATMWLKARVAVARWIYVGIENVANSMTGDWVSVVARPSLAA